MTTKQYTIRNIPPQVDQYLRTRARLSGKSLNDVVISELSANAGVGKQGLAASLDWFIGNDSIDDKTIQVIKDAKAEQKALSAKELDLAI